MSDTLPNVTLPEGVWVDLYAATGITVGTQIVTTNLSSRDVRLVTKATAPLPTDGYVVVERHQEHVNEVDDSGAWAMCHLNGAVNVRAV